MNVGRKLRLALGSALLAVLFVFALVGHAGVHGAGSAPADPPCAMCSPVSDALTVFAAVSPVFDAPRLLDSSTEAPLRLDVPILHPSRGPPSRG